jgi:hypothetical protein
MNNLIEQERVLSHPPNLYSGRDQIFLTQIRLSFTSQSGQMKPVFDQPWQILHSWYLQGTATKPICKLQNHYSIDNIEFDSFLNRGNFISEQIKQYSSLLAEQIFAQHVKDAINRRKMLANLSDYDIKPAVIFLAALKLLYPELPRISFYENGAKARFFYQQREFVADYDYEEPDSVFVSTFIDDILVVKDGSPNTLLEILEHFNV